MTTVTDDHRLSTGLGDESSSSVVVTRSVFFMAERPRRRIPDATVARLPIYLRILHELVENETTGISSEQLAELAAVNAAKVRKDLSYLGSYGTRGIGYEVRYLVFQIERELGLNHEWPVVIVGAGNLGQALSGYGGFGQRDSPLPVSLISIQPKSAAWSVG